MILDKIKGAAMLWMGIATLALAVTASVLYLRIDAEQADAKLARGEAKTATERAAGELVARQKTEAELDKANKLAKTTKDALDEAHQATETARSDAVRARRAGDSLRQYAADLAAAANKASCDPAVASAGPAASTPADLLADLSGRVGEASDEIADFAERAHAAGTACERIHGAAVTVTD